MLLDPVIRWIAYTPSRFWLYYISPVSWSSIENWTIVGSTHPLNGQIVVCASIILNLIMLCLTFIVEKKKHSAKQSVIDKIKRGENYGRNCSL